METELFNRIKNLLANKSLMVFDEALLQRQVEKLFIENNLTGRLVKEYVLSKRDRVDFFAPDYGAAIEVKINSSAMVVYRQLQRYAESGEVKEIILLTRRKMSLPEFINEKPANCFYLSSAWL